MPTMKEGLTLFDKVDLLTKRVDRLETLTRWLYIGLLLLAVSISAAGIIRMLR